LRVGVPAAPNRIVHCAHRHPVDPQAIRHRTAIAGASGTGVPHGLKFTGSGQRNPS
jgi:hypothetical protein